jgi:UDP-N-acetylglucosamine acyltransferase
MNDLYNDEFIDDGRNRIHKTAVIGDNVTLGRGNIILPYAVIGYPGAIRGLEKYQGKIIIGNNNFIGAHVTIMGGRDITTIGSENIIMNKVNIGHDCTIGDQNEIGAGCMLAGHVSIGESNSIKLSCTIRNRVKIGSFNTIGQMSNVITDIEDSFIYYGNPAIKIR